MDYGVSLSMESVDNISKHKVSYCLYVGIKRVFDIFCALCGLIVLLPLSIIVKIAYVITGDFNSIYFSQFRIGKDGKLFKMYKFRTMVPNADDLLKEILEADGDLAKEYRENKKMVNDPRITKIGKILRKLSLDELPQSWNILKNDMSVIGNRPYLPKEKDDMGMAFKIIVSTKPGLTGYWQTNGRSDASFGKRLELESYYSLHKSLKMDIKIFFRTFLVVFKGL